MNPSSEVFGWAIFAATFLGPVFAVLMTRFIDQRREVRNRRLYIFRALMATRRAPLTTEHVTALNLIEIDFRQKHEVLSAWKEYFSNLATDPDNEPAIKKAYADRPAALTRLLHSIAKVVNYKTEQLDIMIGGYWPQGAQDNVKRQQELQATAIEVLSGKKPLLVKAAQ